MASLVSSFNVAVNSELSDLLKRVLVPLIERDGGQLYWVESDQTNLRLHLTGRFSGCPGNFLVEKNIITPFLTGYCPNQPLTLTSGPLIPDGAVRVMPDS